MTDIVSSPTDLARVEPNPRWIRGRIGDRTVVDTTDAVFVWEIPHYPQWYVPVADVGGELRPTGAVAPTGNRGDAEVLDLVLDDGTVVAGAARRHPDSPIPELRDRVRFRWDALDHWYEEEVEVFVHPRSPYTRVDILPSTRRVVVRIDGTVVADSSRASILYETGLPPRYYLPPADVRTDLLTPTETATSCPYKGTARYWSVEIGGEMHDDIAWGYDDPLPESAGIEGLICFYDERVELEVGSGRGEERS
jgi:uncharacterized protein (DUF427 family)